MPTYIHRYVHVYMMSLSAYVHICICQEALAEQKSSLPGLAAAHLRSAGHGATSFGAVIEAGCLVFGELSRH